MILRFAFLALAVTLFLSTETRFASAQESQEQIKGTPAEPTDAAEVREQIAAVEKLMTVVPDRGAALYFLATAKQHLGETREALKLLKDCLALGEGFDPSGDPAFLALRGTKEFDTLIERVHKDFPVVAKARVELVTQEKDLIPEGLAWDEKQNVFYLSSLHRRKIVKITPESRTTDFAAEQPDKLLPVLGIRVDPTDGTVWANSMEEEHGLGELLHFDVTGKLLGRFQLNDGAKHGFNDLVVRKNGEVVLTDSLGNAVYRFEPGTRKFSRLSLSRSVFYPNGIALAGDDRTVYATDALGVTAIDLETGSSRDVDPGPHSTLAGVDGLYWRNGSLIAIQNGIGAPRVALFKLSKDGLRVTQTTVLENRTPLTELPTTGAIRGNDFYFIVNSQIDNLNGERVLDVTRLAPVRIAVVRLP